MNSNKTAGCSGISNNHIKFLYQNKIFINTLKLGYEEILNHPEN